MVSASGTQPGRIVLELAEFRNCPLTDFSSDENRQKMRTALSSVRERLNREYPVVIGGTTEYCDDKFQSYNPARRNEVVGVFQQVSPKLLQKAIASAEEAFKRWSKESVEERVRAVLRVSQLMKERRLELAAWMVVEVGKPWVEADADVAEAIDFCEYYARQMLQLAEPAVLPPIEDEEPELRYIPLGVGAVIPPWNFPLAILTGMTIASIVAGNTVVLKPSSDSPAIAAQFFRILEDAELSKGVVQFVTGSGSKIGDPLVLDPRTRFIAFTGSREVGLRINEQAARIQPGQIWLKRVVAEMGGKNAIIVDEDCDLDEAVDGVIVSAFGYQGQKCSACSRAIVLEPLYDRFIKHVTERMPTLVREGELDSADVNFGPVINQRAQESILRYIETGQSEGRLVTGGQAGSSDGYFVQPTVFADIDPEAIIAQEEIFGPVLVVIKARDFSEALEIANGTQYGLTGAVYSSNEARIRRAKNEFHVGNLYINRKCTGALVGVHPFGGFNMSGTDSKAGGSDYLLLFSQAKSISRRKARSQ